MKEVLASTKAEITFPKALKDMLIFVASCKRTKGERKQKDKKAQDNRPMIWPLVGLALCCSLALLYKHDHWNHWVISDAFVFVFFFGGGLFLHFQGSILLKSSCILSMTCFRRKSLETLFQHVYDLVLTRITFGNMPSQPNIFAHVRRTKTTSDILF